MPQTSAAKAPAPRDDHSVGRPPAARTYLCWSRALLQVAEMQADVGSLRLAADLCEALLGDGRIQALLRTRVQALLGLTPTFSASSGDGRRHSRVGRALEQEEDFWKLCPVDESALLLTWGLLLGVAIGRLEYWDTDAPANDVAGVRMHKGRVVPRIRFWHPRFLRYDARIDAWFVRTAAGTEERVTPGHGGWLLFTPYGRSRPSSTAPWRGIKDFWLTKHRAREDWDNHGEKGAIFFVEAAQSARPEQRQDMGAQLNEAAGDLAVVAPNGYKGDFFESTSTGQLHSGRIDTANSEFAVTLLGHANNAEVKGANTGATAGENVRYDLATFDAEAWSNFVHDQVLEVYAEDNFGDRELAQYPLYPVKKPDDTVQRGQGLKALGEGVKALTDASDRVDGDKILETAGVPMLSDAELAKKREEKAALTPPPAPPPPAPGPAPAPAPAGPTPPPDKAAATTKEAA